MKKVLFTIVLAAIILLCSDTFAQFKFRIGPRVGINLANLSFDPDLQDGIDKSSRFGFKFGALAELGFAPMFAVQIEPMYVMKGAKLEAQGATRDIDLSYIEIPILFKVKFAAGSVTPYVFAGPDIGLLLSANLNDEFNGQTQETDIKETTSSIDFVIDLGAGVGFAVGPGTVIMFDVRYALGLSNLNDDPNDPNTTIKSSGIQIVVGAAFALN